MARHSTHVSSQEPAHKEHAADALVAGNPWVDVLKYGVVHEERELALCDALANELRLGAALLDNMHWYFRRRSVRAQKVSDCGTVRIACDYSAAAPVLPKKREQLLITAMLPKDRKPTRPCTS